MAGDNNQREGGNMENEKINVNRKPSSSTKKYKSRSFQKRKYKFFGHEALKENNRYTYGRILEQIILKIQTTFEGPTGSLVVDSLINYTKHVFG